MRKNLAKLSALAITGAASLYLALPALAVPPTATNEVNLCTGDKAAILCALTVGKVVTGGIQFVLIAAFLLAFAFLVIGGIKWITSGGDKAGTEAAKGTITAALIGLIIVLISWALINFVGTFFNLPNVTTFQVTPIN